MAHTHTNEDKLEFPNDIGKGPKITTKDCGKIIIEGAEDSRQTFSGKR